MLTFDQTLQIVDGLSEMLLTSAACFVWRLLSDDEYAKQWKAE